MIAKVAVDTKTSAVDRIFEYEIPENLESRAVAGVRCALPFGGGNKKRVGFILSVSESSEYKGKLKKIVDILDEKPLISRQRLVEAFRIKNRYFSSFMEAIRLYLPVGVKTDIDEVYFPCDDVDVSSLSQNDKIIYGKISEKGKLKYEALKTEFGSNVRNALKRMEEEGIIKSEFNWRDRENTKYITVYSLSDKNINTDSLRKNAASQRRVIDVLKSAKYFTMPDLCLFAGCSVASVKSLEKKGIVLKKQIERKRNHLSHAEGNETYVTLTKEQENAVKTILGEGDKPYLLRGVTGSGKTTVYIEVIKKVLSEGKSAILLVPEISLTHQLVGKFIENFGDKVALLHSKLTDGERFDEWMRISSEENMVVIGARSAVFAPCDNIGVIILDEEHEDTYKSESGVRYDTREVALIRAKSSGAKVIFASATPKVEDYYRAKEGIYTLCEMHERYNGANMPESIIVDMRQELKSGNRSPISSVLHNEICKNLSNEEQTILFLNKRGYSSFLSCRDCGFVKSCPNCSISLTYHSYGEYLMCHYCGHRESMIYECPQCGSSNIKGFGTGVQKIEEKIEEEFGGATLLRMDVDTTAERDAHEKILDSFRNDNIDILLGTQMVAKGLDFENVTLVGVLAADQILNIGDFRAGERTFDLITQVLGRSGRGERRGRAVIQTYMPENSTIGYASKHDYQGFYEEEISVRKLLHYPPFCDIINVLVFGDKEEEVKKRIMALYSVFNKMLESEKGIYLYSPVPCLVDKIKNKYRWHFWFKCPSCDTLSKKIRKILDDYGKTDVIVEINPNSI